MHTFMVLRHPADLVLNCSNHHAHPYGGEAFSWPCVRLLQPPCTPSTLTLVKAISCSVSERPHWCLLVTVLRHADEHVLTAPTTMHALNHHSVEASSWPCVKLLQPPCTSSTLMVLRHPAEQSRLYRLLLPSPCTTVCLYLNYSKNGGTQSSITLLLVCTHWYFHSHMLPGAA